jgi:hypothetical protein
MKMTLVTPNIALIFFAVIIVISATIAWWMGTYADYDKGSFHTFIAILAGLGVFVTFMFYWNVVQLQNQQQQLAALQEFARINDSVLDSVLDSIRDSSDIIPNFVLSITPLTNVVCCSTGNTGNSSCVIPVGPDPVNPRTCTQKMVLSYRIFALWQDITMSANFTQIDSLSYISNFLQRANSPQLYVQWTAAKLDFNNDTQQLGDLLFEYGLPITNQTPQEYISVAEKLIADPRYQNIFKI